MNSHPQPFTFADIEALRARVPGLSQEKLAEAVGSHKVTYTNWKKKGDLPLSKANACLDEIYAHLPKAE